MIFYRLLIILLSPAIVGYTLWLSIINKQSRYFWQRIGYKYPDLPEDILWFHCASVGEVNTLLALINNLHKQDDDLKILITTNTITGGKIVAQQNKSYVYHCYMPIDWRLSVKNFLSAIKPNAVYIMETEIWPNLFSICYKNSTAIYIINARLSQKTTAAKSWIKQVYKTCLLQVDTIYSRSERDSASYKLLGAKNETVKTVGNLKLTTALTNTPTNNKATLAMNRKYVLIASTHKDEEIQIYNIWKKLKRSELLIIAPRHPERSASIVKQLNSNSIAVRSKHQEITNQTKVFILDTVGELKDYFNKAELVIMGGSFVPIGGHNILEPASFNCAIITGPYMDNFIEELTLMLDKNAIVQVTSKLQSYSRLKEKIENILNNTEYRETLKNNTEKLSHNIDQILNDYTNVILKN